MFIALFSIMSIRNSQVSLGREVDMCTIIYSFSGIPRPCYVRAFTIVLGDEHKALEMLGEHSTIELHPLLRCLTLTHGSFQVYTSRRPIRWLGKDI